MFACESSVFMTLMEFTMAQVQYLTVDILRDQKTLSILCADSYQRKALSKIKFSNRNKFYQKARKKMIIYMYEDCLSLLVLRIKIHQKVPIKTILYDPYNKIYMVIHIS